MAHSRRALLATLVTAAFLGSAFAASTAEAAPKPLKKLRTLELAHRDSSESGTLAFDGRAVYYAPLNQGGGARSVVHRMSPVTGRDLGDLDIDVPGLFSLNYDARRHH
ncbi:MAG: hypothetical protein ABR520_01090, partial [Mycobacteriales bacterium]|nr:hypothetical protein [Frankia sp.]